MGEYRFADVGGRKIAYLREGEGDTLLLVHGMTTYSFIWEGLMPSLSESFNVVVPDLLGCGSSDKPFDADYSIKAQAAMAAGLLDALGIEESVHFVGHDIGGGIGLIMAVIHPERLKSLTLINTIGYDLWPVQPIKAARIPFIRDVMLAAFNLGFLKMLVSRGLYHKERATEELLKRFWMPLGGKEGKHGFLQLAKYLNNEHLMEITGDLKSLELPVLIIRGDGDAYLSPEISERLHADIRGSRLEHIRTGGHFIQVDEPGLLAGHIKNFISGVTGRDQ